MNKLTIVKYLAVLVLIWGFVYAIVVTLYVQLFKAREIDVITNYQPLSDEVVLGEMKTELLKIPMTYFNEDTTKDWKFNDTCAKYPDLFDLIIDDDWQTLRTTNETIQLFGAYFDRRQGINAVRILVMLDTKPSVKTFCQIWFESSNKPMLIETQEYQLIWNENFYVPSTPLVYQPYLITCHLPNLSTPVSVSLVKNKCDSATNHLRIDYKVISEKKGFAVCVKGLDFIDKSEVSIKLVEWIELLNLLGVDKIYLYDFGTHESIANVLKHYEELGRVEVTPLTLAGGQPNGKYFRHYYLKKKVWRKRLNELIAYNDCFYRHMYEYDYIVLLDIDEVIVPKFVDNWGQLMKIIINKANGKRSVYCARVAYYLDVLNHEHAWIEGIPKHFHMLQHVNRLTNYSQPYYYTKCFHDTDEVVTLHNHIPFSCIDMCTSYSIDIEDAQVNHYRHSCIDEEDCRDIMTQTVKDANILRYKSRLIQNVNEALSILA